MTKWYEALAARCPHVDITGRSTPSLYLRRYQVIGTRDSQFQVMLHQFYRGDDDDHPHCHPWPFVNFVLSGGYWELTPKGQRYLKPGSVRFRGTHSFHMVKIDPSKAGKVWTLVIRGPRSAYKGTYRGRKVGWGFLVKRFQPACHYLGLTEDC